MGHIPPPYCAPDILVPFVFTNDPLTVNESEAKALDRNELDTDTIAENTRRGLIATPLPTTDVPAIVDQTDWKKVHMDQLKAAIDYMNNPTEAPNRNCPGNSDAYCPTNTKGWCVTDSVGPTLVWTNPIIIRNESEVQAVDIADRRTNLNLEAVSCICEQEACNYCSDCGYYYQTSYIVCPGDAGPCRCDDHLGPECACQQTIYVDHWDCATINAPAGTVYSTLPAITRTGPWNCMCNFTPPGISWTTYNPPHAPGNPHPTWGCMCNPYTWNV